MITLLHPAKTSIAVDAIDRENGTFIHVHREMNSSGITHIVFDRRNGSANIFDDVALRELEEHVTWIEQHIADIRGVIFVSRKENIFLAGADLKMLNAAPRKLLEKMIGTGQVLFERIARLPIPTVAMIHGACLGGGLELALACDWRIASSHRSTRIGLPEVQLGILPAWGGCTRLPKLLGLPKALSMILTGRQLKGSAALKIGVIDEVVAREYLEDHAEKAIARGVVHRKPHRLTNHPLVVRMIVAKARQDILTKTQGNYPAPLRALAVAANSLSSTVDESFENERNDVLELAASSEAKNLIRAFLLQERAKKRVSRKCFNVSDVAVIGAGVMGSGIAYWLATRGYRVTLQDVSNDAVAAGLKRIHKNFDTAVNRKLLSRLEARDASDRIFATGSPVPLHRVGIVIEAATEKLDIKRAIFRDLSERTERETLLVTNTSALPISEIVRGANIRHPERVLGMHFFNPVHRMPLVEVVRGGESAPAAIDTAADFVRAIGKTPLVVADSPGFVVNRILMPFLMEAGSLFDRSVPVAEIDDAMVRFGMPMGPLRLLDEIGIDVAHHVAVTLGDAFPDRFSVPSILARMLDSGLFGRKSGAGFYSYDRKKPSPNINALACHRGVVRDGDRSIPIEERLSLLMINEAAHCLHEGVVRRPEDIDLAMLLGTGWAPFRGGPLRHAREAGVSTIVRKLEELHCAEGALYAPSPILKRWGNLEIMLEPKE
ncbi:MAG: 3-hydroxyacyl-CoA dehydrogenase/enoyl-CoA hydratase/3-hydroxybutyryl-CoA epimerase [Verrucomicrobiales bacterium]|jgi:3-hydroxyacyl-CoA dehydrogenase/enoyl-CoA hydratase/3-hydroxybutyryl-CoA epimerase